jgi:spore coat protein U-like protein
MNKKLLAMAVAAGMGMTGAAWAATDGTVGATSSGSVDVLLVIPSLIQVVVEGNVDLGTFDPAAAADETGAIGACVRTNGATTYDITATSANDNAGVFRMSDGAGFNRDNVGPGFSTCTATGNGKIDVVVPEANMLGAEAGSYQDTVTLLVAPI